jgi:PIN domain nuclease of toxin-antitoxin system
VKLLLDSHTLIWAVDDPSCLGTQATTELKDSTNELFLSVGSIWEIAIKVGLNKLSLSLPFDKWMALAIADLGLIVLPITVEVANAQIGLPKHHRDPFDRLLVAQAKTEAAVVVSADTVLDRYGVERCW